MAFNFGFNVRAGFRFGILCFMAGILVFNLGMSFIKVSTLKAVQPLQRPWLPARTRSR